MRDLSTLLQLPGPPNVSDTCNTNTDGDRTTQADVYHGSVLFSHSHMPLEHNCVNRLDCRVLIHYCAQKELSYCLVEEPIERFCDRLQYAPIAPPTLPSMYLVPLSRSGSRCTCVLHHWRCENVGKAARLIFVAWKSSSCKAQSRRTCIVSRNCRNIGSRAYYCGGFSPMSEIGLASMAT
jgi:hypothetical protein